jgi:hypothetical protein
LTWISERLISDCAVPPMVTKVSLTPGTVRSLLAIDSVKASLAASEEPLGSSILTENMLRSSVLMNSEGNMNASMMLAAKTRTATRTVSPRCRRAAPNTLR